MSRSPIFSLVLVMLLSACSTGPPESIEGEWLMVESEVDGESQPVAVGENTRELPWVVIDDSGRLRGSSGCNTFTGFYDYSDGILETWTSGTQMLCSGDSGSQMRFELAFSQLMRNRSLVVAQRGDRMTWTGPDSALVLEMGTPDDRS